MKSYELMQVQEEFW